MIWDVMLKWCHCNAQATWQFLVGWTSETFKTVVQTPKLRRYESSDKIVGTQMAIPLYKDSVKNKEKHLQVQRPSNFWALIMVVSDVYRSFIPNNTTFTYCLTQWISKPHRSPVDSPHKGPVIQEAFPCHAIIITHVFYKHLYFIFLMSRKNYFWDIKQLAPYHWLNHPNVPNSSIPQNCAVDVPSVT